MSGQKGSRPDATNNRAAVAGQKGGGRPAATLHSTTTTSLSSTDQILIGLVVSHLLGFPGSKLTGVNLKHLCQFHTENHPSASSNIITGLGNCKACGETWNIKKLARQLNIKAPRPQNGRAKKRPINLAQLATDKGLPADFLTKKFGLFNLQCGGVGIPYKGTDGVTRHTKQRTALVAKDGSYWPAKQELMEYGLEDLADWKTSEYPLLEEGESDRWTARLHGWWALGIPGANATSVLQIEDVQGVPKIYAIKEPDRAGQTFIEGLGKRLAALSWKGEAYAVELPDGIKDLNELHKMQPDDFDATLLAAIHSGTPIPVNDPEAPAADQEDSLPRINAGNRNLPSITDLCWDALRASNDPPHLFRHGGVPSRLEKDDQGAPVIRELTPDRMMHTLARVADWYAIKEVKKEQIEVSAHPPMYVVRDVLATPNPLLPILTRIVEAPVFASDGTLQTAPGYHPAARTYHAACSGLHIPDVPLMPSPEHVERARNLILEELLGDFPFVGNADLAHAVALMLQPFARELISGPTPNHMIEASIAGSGKGLLASVLLVPAIGRHLGVIAEARDSDEWRKRITSCLRDGKAAILLDNIIHPLDCGPFAAALTTETWDDRILGRSENVSLPIRCAWVTTANNPTMSTEIARRTIRIRLAPEVEQPWLREDFRYPNLKGWVDQNRGDLIWAALVLVQNWIAQGKPAPNVKPLGSYEQWTTVIGGILEASGIEGFLANLSEFYEAADTEGAIWRSFVDAWWEKFHEDAVKSSDLFPLAMSTEGIDLGPGTPRSQQITLGKLLGKQRDRVIGEYRIVAAGTVSRAALWRLLPIRDLLTKVNVMNKSECLVPKPTREVKVEEREKSSIQSGAPNIHKHSQHSLSGSSDKPRQVGDWVNCLNKDGCIANEKPMQVVSIGTENGQRFLCFVGDIPGTTTAWPEDQCEVVPAFADAPTEVWNGDIPEEEELA